MRWMGARSWCHPAPQPPPVAPGPPACCSRGWCSPQQQHGGLLQTELAGGLAKGDVGTIMSAAPSLPARPAGSDAKGTSGALQQECWALDKLIVLQGVE